MKVDHDEDGVSLDMSLEEAEDLAVYLFSRREKKALAPIQTALHSVFIGQPRYERRIRSWAGEERDRKAGKTVIPGGETARCDPNQKTIACGVVVFNAPTGEVYDLGCRLIE